MTTSTKLAVRKGATLSMDPAIAARELHHAIDQPNTAIAIFYCSPEYDLPALGRELKSRFGDVTLIGCTTAGEISPTGYLHGSLTGVSVSASDFLVSMRHMTNLSEFEIARGEEVANSLVADIRRDGRPPCGQNTFGFLLIDGLSMQEEAVVSALHRRMADMALFGGSAGDETRFESTHIYCDGEFHQDSAIVCLMQTDRPFVVFKTEHFVPSEKKLVVTKANPEQRIVTEINGEPAAPEYARMVGLEVKNLTPMIFATYPVVVRLGGSYYVRSIQKVNDDGSLTFFCAIDEGIVLTVARGVDLAENLSQAFEDVRQKIGPPELVIGCDCILRHLEVERKGITDEVGKILVENNVIGFSTYGEQYNAMHVNQTFTGVAIGA